MVNIYFTINFVQNVNVFEQVATVMFTVEFHPRLKASMLRTCVGSNGSFFTYLSFNFTNVRVLLLGGKIRVYVLAWLFF